MTDEFCCRSPHLFGWWIYLIRLLTTTQINCSQYNTSVHTFPPSLSITLYQCTFWNVTCLHGYRESNQLLSPVRMECGLTNRKYYHVELARVKKFVCSATLFSISLTRRSILCHNVHAVLVLFCVHSHHKTMCILLTIFCCLLTVACCCSSSFSLALFMLNSFCVLFPYSFR